MDLEHTEVFTFLHFNDVYEVDSMEKLDICGGAARFATKVKEFNHLQPIILFGGDCFSPSLLSNFTNGKHMVDVLNLLKVDCAVIGNHDFDFGVDDLEDLCELCKFPWLLTNVIDKDTGKPLAQAKIQHIFVKNGRKFGIIGLVEDEWLDTLSTISIDDVDYIDFVTEGNKLAKALKNDGCDFVIALTHMRWPNNVKVAEQIPDVDLVLAGHDHFYRSEEVNGKYVIVSGCEFRQLSRITVKFHKSGATVAAERIDITLDIVADPEMNQLLRGYSELMNKQLDIVLGRIKTDLDGRFSVVRSRESNIGNFLCDICLSAMNCDVVLINSGTFRSDRIHEAGPFTHRDLRQVLPYLDPMVVIEITGRQLLMALENSVSQYPKLEGRFAQVAGVRFTFDPEKPSQNRIVENSVYVGDEPLDLEKTYRLCTKFYLSQGNDGYTSLKNNKVIVDVDVAPMLCTMTQNYFAEIKVAQGIRKQKSVHRQSIISFRRQSSVDKIDAAKAAFKKRTTTVEELEEFHLLAPMIDGRIKQTNSNYKV